MGTNRSIFWFHFNDVAGDGGSSISDGRVPLQLHHIFIIIIDLRNTRRSRCICKKKSSTGSSGIIIFLDLSSKVRVSSRYELTERIFGYDGIVAFKRIRVSLVVAGLYSELVFLAWLKTSHIHLSLVAVNSATRNPFAFTK